VEPGRLLAGEYPLGWLADSPPMQLKALLQAGLDTFVDLTAPGESRPYDATLQGISANGHAGLQHLRHAIPDFGIPTRESMIDLLDQIDVALAAGRKLYLHCLGGVGRTGTAVGCYLVRHGMTGTQALRQIEQWWLDVPKHVYHPRSPETAEQRQFVLNWNAGT
jgi:hypothetical protein